MRDGGGPARSRVWAQRFGAGGPDAQRRLHADPIGQTAGRDAGAERAVGAIPSVGQQDARSDACGQRGPDLSEGALRFGPECHVVRDTSRLAPGFVQKPNLPADTADRRSAGSPRDWRSKASPRSDNCRSCRAARNAAGRRPPHEPLSSRSPVSSTIHVSIFPCASIPGTTSSRTLARTASSDQAAWPTRCRSDGCLAATRAGATIAAIGSTLLRSPGVNKPMQ
jgi:hypothetical protein